MFNIDEIRNQFPMLKNNKDLIYFDNSSTTFKPYSVIKAVEDYYLNYSVNYGRGEYDLSFLLDAKIDAARKSVADFINANENEIVFTSNTTVGLNTIAFGYGGKFLQKDDIILITEAEHASNVLPWIKIVERTGAKIRYIPLTDTGEISLEGLKKMLAENVKIVSVAQITNVLGYIAPLQEIVEAAHKAGAIVIVDGAQSAGHIAVDVKKINCDFFVFSGHKMCGPTGVGVLYGKYKLLQKTDAYTYGGGSNVNYTKAFEIFLKDPPYKFESGTVMIEAILGLREAICFIKNIGLDEIYEHTKKLHRYAIRQLSTIEHIHLYAPDATCGIIAFNIKNVFADDAAKYFNSRKLCIRSGQHCSRLLHERLNCISSLRASLYFYNTLEEVDRFIEICKNATKKNCVEFIFNNLTRTVHDDF